MHSVLTGLYVHFSPAVVIKEQTNELTLLSTYKHELKVSEIGLYYPHVMVILFHLQPC